MLARAIEAEVAEFLERYRFNRDQAGRALMVCRRRWGIGFLESAAASVDETRVQRCWVHKTANVLNKLPQHLQPKAKSDLHQI